jgi:hypothetical protein
VQQKEKRHTGCKPTAISLLSNLSGNWWMPFCHEFFKLLEEKMTIMVKKVKTGKNTHSPPWFWYSLFSLDGGFSSSGKSYAYGMQRCLTTNQL